jgi:hypothetical protein
VTGAGRAWCNGLDGAFAVGPGSTVFEGQVGLRCPLAIA